MSDTMLHGVLNMPIDVWGDSDLDKIQRASVYHEASEIIKNSTPNSQIQELIGGIEKTIHECRITDELDNYLKFVGDLKRLIKPEGE